MGCGSTKTSGDEQKKNNEQNKEEINNNQNQNEINIEINNGNNEKNALKQNKIKKIEKKTKISKKIENDNKIDIKQTKIPIKKNVSKRNYEDYNEVFDETEEEEEKQLNKEEVKEKKHKERKDFLANLNFTSIFKTDNIDKNNSSILSDTSQRVQITFIPTQKSFPKVTKYLDPIQGVDGPFWEINLKASRNEIMTPFWLEKNKEIIIYITGKWKINDEIECDWNGVPEMKNNYEQYMPNLVKYKFKKGALVGRVIYGEQFLVYDSLRYKSEYDGPLILKMNLNSVWSTDKPSGELNIKIKGAIYVKDIYEIEERIGWRKQLKTIELNNLEEIPEYKIPSLEKMVIILFNKARYNSKLFANQYLDNMKSLTPNSIKIYNEFIINKNQNLPFKVNVSTVKFLQDFYSPFVSGNQNIDDNNNDSLIILKTNKILKKYLEKTFNDKKTIYHISILKYKNKNPFHLASRLIFENEVRENIFKRKCEEISMITIQTKEGLKNNTFYTIVVLSNENGNSNINYDFSKNVKNFINEEKNNNNDHNIISNIKINLNPLPNIFSNENNTKNFYDFN